MEIPFNIEYEVIDKELVAFSYGQIQDCFTLIELLEMIGVDIPTYKKYVEYKKEILYVIGQNKEIANVEIKRILDMVPPCPKCGAPVTLNTVPKAERKNQNKNNYKTVYYCVNEDCDYYKYSTKNIIFEINKIKDEYSRR